MERLRGVIREIRYAVDQVDRTPLYSPAPAKLRILSCLAEGADRLAARAGLGEGCELLCCLPFDRDSYADDFANVESVQEYHDLLQSASAVFEVNIDHLRMPTAYAHVGQVMLEHSDVLMAVWDGCPPAGSGGTGDIVARARRSGVPVIWLDSSAPHDIRVMLGDYSCPYSPVSLHKVVGSILTCPTGAQLAALQVYCRERHHGANLWLLHRAFLRLILPHKPKGLRPSLDPRVPDYYVAAAKALGLEQVDCPSAENCPDWRSTIISPFGWADNLSIYHGEVYRSAAVLRHMMVLVATLGLAVGFYWGFWKGLHPSMARDLGFLIQAAALWGVILLARLNRVRRWQQRYNDYRLLAEMLRVLRYLHPLGIAFSSLRMPAYSGGRLSWVTWPFRAVARSLGIPNVAMTRDQMRHALVELSDGLRGQVDYHEATRGRAGAAHHRLEKAWLLFFGSGIAATLVRVGVHYCQVQMGGRLLEQAGYVCNMLALLLPAAGAAVFATLSQLGYEKLRDRSTGMARQLAAIAGQVDRIVTDLDAGRDIPYDRIRELASDCRVLLLDEVADWRLFAAARSISAA